MVNQAAAGYPAGPASLSAGRVGAAMRAWESEKRYSSDEVWDAVVGPALDGLADYVQNMKIRTR